MDPDVDCEKPVLHGDCQHGFHGLVDEENALNGWVFKLDELQEMQEEVKNK
jgi:hypothetical protein